MQLLGQVILDGLKKINDTYGHLTGSRALCRLADTLRINCRSIDTAARYGGDEFALILPEAQEPEAQQVAARIRDVIDKGQFEAGARLPSEAELAGQLQVSRSVLREAVSRLEAQGVLNVRRGKGMYVGDRGSLSSCVRLVQSALTIATKDLMQVAELRRGIEVQAARLAAQRAAVEQALEKAQALLT